MIPNSFRAVVAKTGGGPDVLELVERPVPAPGQGKVLIKVAAAGLNGADLTQRLGRYVLPKGTPDIFGLEVSGTIAALGDGVTEWKLGQETCALLIGGGYGEYCVAPSVQCAPVPNGVSLVDAAGLPEVAATVWSNVFEIGGLKPHETLLVHGG